MDKFHNFLKFQKAFQFFFEILFLTNLNSLDTLRIINSFLIMPQKKKKYTKDSTLAEVLEDPKKRKILEKFNVPCLTCPFAQIEMNSLTLEQISKFYDIELEKLLEELNKD
ncbi:MAG: hypothetical protein DRN07_05410 [Thermoplasmata archaeon]|nr:MAG: hypothetical protein DRN07_05410 [Thermoplasmata archaeon]